MVVLSAFGVLAYVEPTDTLRQHHNRSEWGSRHHLGNAFSSDPLKAHQQRELALHGSGKG
jgi:hypothetical protein